MKLIVVVDENNNKKNIAINKIRKVFYGCDCFVIPVGNLNDAYIKQNNVINNSYDFVIALGGDGTIIKTAKYFYVYDKKIFGINIGHTGFLSSIESINELVEISINDISNMQTIDSDFICCKHYRNDKIIDKYLALNEIFITSKQLGLMGKYELYDKDGKQINLFHSDALLVSTQTGSTAYSLSCGGPIVDNDIGCFLIIPIRSHSINNRSIILSNKNNVKVKILRENQIVKVDGRDDKETLLDDYLVLSKSNKKAKFIAINNESFLDRLISRIKII